MKRRRALTSSTDLHDDKKMDLSPERFSKENLESHAADMDRLYGSIIEQARSMLSAEQMAAFEQAIQAIVAMQKAQMEMAGQMFGGGQ